MTTEFFICPKKVLGPGTVCNLGVPEGIDGTCIRIGGIPIICRAWMNLPGRPGFCKLIDGIVIGGEEM